MHNFHRRFLWRVAGFPCEALEQFGMDLLADKVQQVTTPSATEVWPSWWAVRGRALVDSGLREHFVEQFAALRRQLSILMGESRFQAAVAYSSPDAASSLARYGSGPLPARKSSCKRRELLAMRYLQRFVTKCETAAFVGPTITGRFTRTSEGIEYRFHPADYAPRAFVSTGVLVQLTRHLRRYPDVMMNVQVRRRSATALRGSLVVHPSAGLLALNSSCLDVLRATSKPVRVHDLRNVVDCSSTELVQIVYALVRLGLLADEFDSLFSSSRPLDRVMTILGRAERPHAAGVSHLLEILSDILERWPRAEPTERVALLASVEQATVASGLPPAWTEGQFFADSLPVVEDGACATSFLAVDETVAAPMLAELEAALRRSVGHGWTARLEERSAVAARLRAWRGDRAPLVDAIVHIGHELGRPEASPSGCQPPPPSSPVVTSPDVMLAATDADSIRRGDYGAVLAESHSAIGCAGFQSRVIPNPREWLVSVSDFLGAQLAPYRPVLPTAVPVNKTSYLGPLPGVSYLEVGLPAPDGTERIDLDDLDVLFDGDDGPSLVNRTTGEPVALLPNGPRDTPAGLLDVFRPPRFWRDRQDGPRRSSGRVVEKRAAWTVVPDGLPGSEADPFEVFVWAQHVRARYGLPRWVFIHPADERKPICIDISNPFLCEELLRHVRRCPALYVEEMYPSPNEAWATSPDGRHLSELRLLYASRS